MCTAPELSVPKSIRIQSGGDAGEWRLRGALSESKRKSAAAPYI